MNRQKVSEAITHTPTEEFVVRRQELSSAAEEAGLTVEEINAALAARPDLPRPLLPRERETLLALLQVADFEGRDALVEQVDSATVVGYCPCPCATISLEVAPLAPRAPHMPSRTIPNEARVLDAGGETIGGIVVFADDGYLSAVEIFDYLDVPGISPLPPLDRLELGRVEEQPSRRRWPWIWRLARPPRRWRPYSVTHETS